ncbi:hypothetical protein GCM10020000_74840 [Streptomyces olivoverticillatus]
MNCTPPLKCRARPPRCASEFDDLLKSALAIGPRTLVLDEARWLQSGRLECVRYLGDEPCTQLAVIFAGGEGCHAALR